MDTTNGKEYLRRIYAQEANKGEMTAYVFRWALIAILAVLAFFMFKSGTVSIAGGYGLMIDGVGLIYNSILFFFIRKVDRFPFFKYVSVSIDIGLVTGFYLLVSLYQNPTAVGTSVVMYLLPTLIFLAALRQDRRLIVYATLYTAVLSNVVYFARYEAIPADLLERVYMIGPNGQVFRTVYYLVFGFFMLKVPAVTMRLLTKQQAFFDQAREGLDRLSSEMEASARTLDALAAELEGAAAAVSQAVATIDERLRDTRAMTDRQESSFRESVKLHDEMSSVSGTLRSLISRQNGEIERCAQAVREMTGSSAAAFESTKATDRESSELMAISNEGKELLSGMGRLVEEVAAKSKSLVDVVAAVESIAERTDLLALNAAIEAAHAGLYGKGFSVVADEIKRLAAQSEDQTRKVGEELRGIRASVEEVVGSSRRAEEAFGSIFTRIGAIGGSIRDINSSMDRQLSLSESISGSIDELGKATGVVEDSGNSISEHARRMDAGLKEMKEANLTIDSNARTILESSAGISGMMSRLLELSRENRRTISSIVEQMDVLKGALSG